MGDGKVPNSPADGGHVEACGNVRSEGSRSQYRDPRSTNPGRGGGESAELDEAPDWLKGCHANRVDVPGK